MKDNSYEDNVELFKIFQCHGYDIIKFINDDNFEKVKEYYNENGNLDNITDELKYFLSENSQLLSQNEKTKNNIFEYMNVDKNLNKEIEKYIC